MEILRSSAPSSFSSPLAEDLKSPQEPDPSIVNRSAKDNSTLPRDKIKGLARARSNVQRPQKIYTDGLDDINAKKTKWGPPQTPLPVETPTDCRVSIMLKEFGLDQTLYLDILQTLQQKYLQPIGTVDSLTALLLRAKEVKGALTALLKAFGKKHKFVISVTESQWIDKFSLDVLYQLKRALPEIGFVFFGRPFSSLDSKETQKIYQAFVGLSDVKRIILSGLNLQETKEVIRSCFPELSGVDVDMGFSKIILERTDGNPFFIKSLILSLKDGGHINLNSINELQLPADFNVEKYFLGHDNQAIILAQFDRIDRHFQLFVKIGAIIGEKFMVDDVLYIMTGIPGISSFLNQKNYNDLINTIKASDRFSFLLLESLGHEKGFRFKSAILRSCIYKIIGTTQKQHLHLKFAEYYADNLKLKADPSKVILVLDHYLETSAEYDDKKLQYLEIASGLCYDKNMTEEATKYYSMLIKYHDRSLNLAPAQVNEFSVVHGEPPEKNVLARWFFELGDCHYAQGEDSEGVRCLQKSLDLMGFAFPKDGFFGMKLALRKLERERKINNMLFEDLEAKALDYHEQSFLIQRSPKNKAVPNVTEIEKGLTSIEEFRQSRASENEVMLLCLSAVGGLYFEERSMEKCKYCIMYGLNMKCENFEENTKGRLFSLAAMVKVFEKQELLRSLYLERASTLDNHKNVSESLHILINSSHVYEMMGQVDNLMTCVKQLVKLIPMTRFHRLIGKALRVCCIASLLNGSPERLKQYAHELTHSGKSQQDWSDEFSGMYYAILANILNGGSITYDTLQEWDTLWLNGQEEKKTLVNKISYNCLKACILVILNPEDADVFSLLSDLLKLMDQIDKYCWKAYRSLITLTLTLFVLSKRTNEPKLLRLVRDICEKLDSLSHKSKIPILTDLRRLFKGIGHMMNNNFKKMISTWKKSRDNKSTVVLYQSILHLALIEFKEPDMEIKIVESIKKRYQNAIRRQ
jgi:tetratricopeptide (TPR) repeat protein